MTAEITAGDGWVDITADVTGALVRPVEVRAVPGDGPEVRVAADGTVEAQSGTADDTLIAGLTRVETLRLVAADGSVLSVDLVVRGSYGVSLFLPVSQLPAADTELEVGDTLDFLAPDLTEAPFDLIGDQDTPLVGTVRASITDELRVVIEAEGAPASGEIAYVEIGRGTPGGESWVPAGYFRVAFGDTRNDLIGEIVADDYTASLSLDMSDNSDTWRVHAMAMAPADGKVYLRARGVAGTIASAEASLTGFPSGLVAGPSRLYGRAERTPTTVLPAVSLGMIVTARFLTASRAMQIATSDDDPTRVYIAENWTTAALDSAMAAARPASAAPGEASEGALATLLGTPEVGAALPASVASAFLHPQSYALDYVLTFSGPGTVPTIASNGAITGTFSAPGTYSITGVVRDARFVGRSVSQTLTVIPASVPVFSWGAAPDTFSGPGGDYNPRDLRDANASVDFVPLETFGTPTFGTVAAAEQGARHFRMEAENAVSGVEMQTQTVTPGVPIRISAIARLSDETAARLRFQARGAANARIGFQVGTGEAFSGLIGSEPTVAVFSDLASFETDGGWRYFEATITPATGVTSLALGVLTGNGTGVRGYDLRTLAWSDEVPPAILGAISAPAASVVGTAVTVTLAEPAQPASPDFDALGPTPYARGLPAPTLDVRVLRDGVDVGSIGALTAVGQGFTASYTPVTADIGHTITFRATATNTHGTAALVSAAMEVSAPADIDFVRYVDPASVATAPGGVAVTTTVADALATAKVATAGGKAYPTITAACAGAVPAGTLIMVKSGTAEAPLTYDGRVSFVDVIATDDGTLTGDPKPVYLLPEVDRGVRIRGAVAAGALGQAVRILRCCNIEVHNFVIEARGSGTDANPVQISVGDDQVNADGGIWRGQAVIAGNRLQGFGTDMLKAATAANVQVLGNDFAVNCPNGNAIDFVTVFDGRVAFNTFRDAAGLTGPSCRGAFYNKAGGARVVWERNDIDITPADEAVMCGGGGKSRAGIGDNGAPRNMPFGRVGFGYAWAESHQDTIRENLIVSRNPAAEPVLLKGAVGATVTGNWIMVTNGVGGPVDGGTPSVEYDQALAGFWQDQGLAIIPDATMTNLSLTALERGDAYRANIAADATARGVTPPGDRVLLRGSTLNRDGVSDYNVNIGNANCTITNNIRVSPASFVIEGGEIDVAVRTTDAGSQVGMVGSPARPQWDGAASQTASGNTVTAITTPPADFPAVGHGQWDRAAIYALVGVP